MRGDSLGQLLESHAHRHVHKPHLTNYTEIIAFITLNQESCSSNRRVVPKSLCICFRFHFPRVRKKIPFPSMHRLRMSVRFREKERESPGRGTRPTRSSRSDWRLSRERLSNGLSLRFAYGWVRKSANEQEKPRSIDASKEDDVLSSLENGARSWDRPALITRRRTITPIKASLSLFLRYTAFPSSRRFRFIVFPRPRSHTYNDGVSIVSCGRSLSTIKLRGGQ